MPISNIITLRLQRGVSYHFSILAICVKGCACDEDSDWMGFVAYELKDETLELEANGDLDESAVWIFPDQMKEFCRLAEYVCENHDRFRRLAEDKARTMREEYGL